jgi:S1-C subfamily serine protease
LSARKQSRIFPSISPLPKPEQIPRPESLRARFGRFYRRFRDIWLIGGGIFVTFASLSIYSWLRSPLPPLTQRDVKAAITRALASATPGPSYESEVYAIIHPSLVQVEAKRSVAGKEESSLGTGFVIDDRGTILTSLHIIENASEIEVTFADGSESPAVVEVSQPENDLAVLRPLIIPDDLVPAVLAGSGSLRIGDEVVAVGNPFGIRNSLSSGVVSGLGRNIRSPKTGKTLTYLIQFDAAVNPGNSGGPLLNRSGEVVGIVTALLNPTEQDFFIGIGFAVTIETAAAAGGAPPL